MKRKFLISFFIIIVFSAFIVTNVFASDSMVSSVLNQMDTSKVGMTQENQFTKVVRTFYAIIQITVVGGSLIYFTWHSKQFFSSDANERSKAKDALPYRVAALLVILGIDGVISIIVEYLTP